VLAITASLRAAAAGGLLGAKPKPWRVACDRIRYLWNSFFRVFRQPRSQFSAPLAFLASAAIAPIIELPGSLERPHTVGKSIKVLQAQIPYRV
jgi:hypothetical protein